MQQQPTAGLEITPQWFIQDDYVIGKRRASSPPSLAFSRSLRRKFPKNKFLFTFLFWIFSPI